MRHGWLSTQGAAEDEAGLGGGIQLDDGDTAHPLDEDCVRWRSMHPRTTATATAATAATGTENGTAATAAAADDSSAVLLRVERLRHWRAQMRSLRRGRALPRADSCDGG